MQRRKICRYFQKGSCKKSNCPFVHLKENRKNCQFYMKGYCKKGINCNFYHPPKQAMHKVQEKQTLIHHQQQQKQQQKQQSKQQPNHHQIQNYQQETHHQHHLSSQDQIQLTNYQKIAKINFLLGIDDDQQSQQQPHQQQQQHHIIQFNKIFPTKFVDYSKSPQVKQFIKNNQLKYFPKGFMAALNQQQPQAKQHYQIIRKFQDSFRQSLHSPLLYTLNIRPLLYKPQILLNFQMKQQTIDLQIDETLYPKQKAGIKILNKSIPQPYIEKIQNILKKYHSQKSLFETLKYLQNSFQQIYQLSKFKLQNEYYSKKEIQNKIVKEKQKQLQSLQKNNEPKLPITEKQNLKPKQQISLSKQARVIPYKQGQAIPISQTNYNVTVQTTLLQNCQYLIVSRMLLYIQCVCEHQIMHILEGAEIRSLKIGAKLICKKCHVEIIVCLIRQILQHKANLVGKMGIDNGRLIDIGGIGWKIGCNCDGEVIQSKVTLPGIKNTTNCHQCFQTMYIMYQGIKFFNPFIKQFQVQDEKQLPGKGLCQHKKLSFRWYRYGCCGRLFSCDQCHTDESIRRHQKVNGVTMICGYCSYEQSIAISCKNCKKELVKGTDKTGHWEGGYGCRDQNQLSRKDAKKYVGLTKKK